MPKIIVDRMIEDEDGNEVFLKGKPELFQYMGQAVHGNLDDYLQQRMKANPDRIAIDSMTMIEHYIFDSMVGRQMEVTTELDVPSGTYTIKDWRIK